MQQLAAHGIVGHHATGSFHGSLCLVCIQDQAEELAEFLSNPPAEEGLPVPELLFSSPFYRCIQTGSCLAKKMGIPLKLEHGVQEW
jgi:broad specificity phosphatase PhoE